MRFHVLATDYDGTIARDGRVDDTTTQALERLLATGRRLVLVTGRELPELLEIYPRLELFERVVAENGALLYRPATKESVPLIPEPPAELVAALRERNVPLSVGRGILATWQPHESTVLETIQRLGLELQLIFNKGAVMVLPSGINKASGLAAALTEMELSPHNVVGVGDAENDHAFLKLSEFSAAVANALPAVKEAVDWVASADHGAGVVQLIEQLIRDDLVAWRDRIVRHDLRLGESDGVPIHLPAHGPMALLCGPSGSGKSTVVHRIVESLEESKYQFCLVDPEGDYESLGKTVVLGNAERAPTVDEAIPILRDPRSNLIVNLTGMPIPERPHFFLKLLPLVLQLRAHTGRPHWLILDEAHHLLPADWKPSAGVLPDSLDSLVLVTIHPDLLSRDLLQRVDSLFVVGRQTAHTVESFCTSAKIEAKLPSIADLSDGELLWWKPKQKDAPVRLKVDPSHFERRRHRRKYAEGEMAPERSFYFTGPKKALNLRAQNLKIFIQLAVGVDDATWEFHRRNGDYSRWFREGIKDDQLAALAERVEGLPHISPKESRQLIQAAIERDYILIPVQPLPVPGAG